MAATTNREKELIEKWTEVTKKATPEEQERLIMAADLLCLLGKYIYEPGKEAVTA